MKIKLASAGIVTTLALVACTNNPAPIVTTPTQVPSTIINSPTDEPEPSKTPSSPKPEPSKTSKPNNNTSPTVVVPSSDPAAPPATQFAQRWGIRYPQAPEFAILKAANATCDTIEGSEDWQNDSAVIADVAAAIKVAGIESSEALEFAQDAEQNYCSSVSNPT